MPLRPALAAFHPKGPNPKDVRRVNCPHCGDAFNLSRKAISARCPRCTRPLAFEDLTLNSKVEGDVSTMGHVVLGETGEMVGRLVCGRLVNTGRFEGRAVVYGMIELAARSLTTGEIAAKGLLVARGATLRARAKIGPKPATSTVVRTIGSRPLRKGIRRLVGVGSHANAFKPVS